MIPPRLEKFLETYFDGDNEPEDVVDLIVTPNSQEYVNQIHDELREAILTNSLTVDVFETLMDRYLTEQGIEKFLRHLWSTLFPNEPYPKQP